MFSWFRLLYSSAIITSFKNSFIKNAELPVCKECIHFRPHGANEFEYSLGKCSKFGSKDVVSGEITYEFADLCRTYDNKCGKNGTYFESTDSVNSTKKIPLDNYGW